MSNNSVFNFEVDSELFEGIKRLEKLLGFELGNGISVKAKKCDKNGVCHLYNRENYLKGESIWQRMTNFQEKEMRRRWNVIIA